MYTRIRSLDRRLDSFLISDVDGKKRSPNLESWTREAASSDKDILARWSSYVESHTGQQKEFKIGGIKRVVEFDKLRKIELYDPKRYEFWRPLKVENRELCDTWQRSGIERKYFTVEDEKYYPSFRCEQEKKIVGFDFLNMTPDVDDPGSAICADQLDDYGTFEATYADIFPALMINQLVANYKSPHIDFTVIGSGFELFNEDQKITVIRKNVRHDYDAAVIEEKEEEHDEDDLSDESNPLVSDDNEPIQLANKPQMPVPAGYSEFENETMPELPPNPSAEEIAQYREYYKKNVLVILEEEKMEKSLRLKSIAARTKASESIQMETQELYITESKIQLFFEKLMESSSFSNAAKKNTFTAGTRVCRICVSCMPKGHIMKVVWDRLLDSSGIVFEHRLFVCSSTPADEWYYREEYKFSNVNKSFLHAFKSALVNARYLNLDDVEIPVKLYLDTAYRATMRQVFLLDENHGFDMACSAFQILSTLYLSMVENALMDTDAVLQFATYRIKRFIRFHLKCFQMHLRSIIHSEIHDRRRMLWLPAEMQKRFVNSREICLLCVNTVSGHQQKLVYENFDRGFLSIVQPFGSRLNGRFVTHR